MLSRATRKFWRSAALEGAAKRFAAMRKIPSEISCAYDLSFDVPMGASKEITGLLVPTFNFNKLKDKFTRKSTILNVR